MARHPAGREGRRTARSRRSAPASHSGSPTRRERGHAISRGLVRICRAQVVRAALARRACVRTPAPARAPASAQRRLPEDCPGIQIEYKEPTNPRPLIGLRPPEATRCPGRLQGVHVAAEAAGSADHLAGELRWRAHVYAYALHPQRGADGLIAKEARGSFFACYGDIVADERAIAAANLLPGFRREDAAVGAFVSVLLHETGHAIFHLLDIPIFGREEDAADFVGSYVALQFGPATARRDLFGKRVRRACVGVGDDKVAGAPSLCGLLGPAQHPCPALALQHAVQIALGSDEMEGTTTFAEFRDLMPEYRRGFCPWEHEHVRRPFAFLFFPTSTWSIVAKVRAREWLRSEDGVDIPDLNPSEAAEAGSAVRHGSGLACWGSCWRCARAGHPDHRHFGPASGDRWAQAKYPSNTRVISDVEEAQPCLQRMLRNAAWLPTSSRNSSSFSNGAAG